MLYKNGTYMYNYKTYFLKKSPHFPHSFYALRSRKNDPHTLPYSTTSYILMSKITQIYENSIYSV